MIKKSGIAFARFFLTDPFAALRVTVVGLSEVQDDGGGFVRDSG